MKATYAAFSQGTKMPFITCDEETFNDQIWIFATEERAKEITQRFKDENQDFMMIVRIENNQLLSFYGSLHLLGVNEIVFVEEEQVTKIPLDNVVVPVDYSKTPEEKRPVINPQMQLTGLYFMQEIHRNIPTNEKPVLRELEEEMAANLVRSKFLMALELEGETRRPDGSNLKIPCVKNKEGKTFQPIFTDNNELRKFNSAGKFQANVVEFVNIEKVLGQGVEGVVINPQSMNIVISKDKIPALIQRFSQN
ncbi:MAG: SseB family protein [Muricomes sp.]